MKPDLYKFIFDKYDEIDTEWTRTVEALIEYKANERSKVLVDLKLQEMDRDQCNLKMFISELRGLIDSYEDL